MFATPDFSGLTEDELRRTLSDLRFQRDVAQTFLDRAEAEARHRKQKMRDVGPVNGRGGMPVPGKPH